MIRRGIHRLTDPLPRDLSPPGSAPLARPIFDISFADGGPSEPGADTRDAAQLLRRCASAADYMDERPAWATKMADLRQPVSRLDDYWLDLLLFDHPKPTKGGASLADANRGENLTE